MFGSVHENYTHQKKAIRSLRPNVEKYWPKTEKEKKKNNGAKKQIKTAALKMW